MANQKKASLKFYTSNDACLQNIVFTNFKQKYLLESIKRRTKAHEKNVSPERTLNFDQSKSFSQ